MTGKLTSSRVDPKGLDLSFMGVANSRVCWERLSKRQAARLKKKMTSKEKEKQNKKIKDPPNLNIKQCIYSVVYVSAETK